MKRNALSELGLVILVANHYSPSSVFSRRSQLVLGLNSRDLYVVRCCKEGLRVQAH